MKKHLPFLLLTIAAFIGLIVPKNLQDGMFMDGLIYATVSRNLAIGEGSFWFLYLSDTHLTNYHEQLPLFFAIQSAFFKVLGDTMYTERICSLVMACLTVFLTALTWREFFTNNDRYKKLFWLPVLMWVSTPVVFWVFAHNVEETMMSVFAVASVYLTLKGIRKQSYLHIILGGFSIFLCSFCKGPQGLFPLITVGVYWLSFRNISRRKMLIYSSILLLVPAIIYLIFILNEHSYLGLKAYIEARLHRTFNVTGSHTTTNRLDLIWNLAQELIVATSLGLLVRLIHYLKFRKAEVESQRKASFFFLLIGFAGSLPLIITLEQRNFYLATSVPFFALAIAAFAAPYCSQLVESINTNDKGFRLFRILSFLAILGAIVVSVIMSDGIKKGKDVLPDIYAVGDHLGTYQTIAMPRDQKGFGPRTYFMRYYHISVDVGNYEHDYLMQAKESKYPVPKDYTEVDLGLKNYRFYKKLN